LTAGAENETLLNVFVVSARIVNTAASWILISRLKDMFSLKYVGPRKPSGKVRGAFP
jgi:hypothetical protein